MSLDVPKVGIAFLLTVESVQNTHDPLFAELLCGPFESRIRSIVSCQVGVVSSHDSPVKCMCYDWAGKIDPLSWEEEKAPDRTHILGAIGRFELFKQVLIDVSG